MLRFAILLAALGMLAGTALAQEEPVDPRAQAKELIGKAEIALKSHQIAKARRLLEKVQGLPTDGVTMVRAVSLYVEVLVREGKVEEAREALDKIERREDLPEGVPGQLARLREVVASVVRAREFRIKAYRARLESTEMLREAEKAEAHANLMRVGTPTEKIEQHLKAIDDRYAPYLVAMAKEIDGLESGKPHASRPRPAGPHGRTGPPRPGEVIDARRRSASMRARAEKMLSEILRRIDKVIAAYEEGLRSGVTADGEPAARREMLHEIERTLRQALVERLASPDPERLAAAREYRAALEELRARGQRDGRGRERFDEQVAALNERIAGLEKTNEEIRALLEKLVDDR